MTDYPDSLIVGISDLGVMRPNDMRALTKATGRDAADLLGSDDKADSIQAAAFLVLRRRGFRDVDPAELWEAAGDISVDFTSEVEGLDPTTALRSWGKPP